MVELVSFSPFDAYRSVFYTQAAGRYLLTATDLNLEHHHCYSHIILNVAMTLFSSHTFVPFFPYFSSMSLMSLDRIRRILMVLLHCFFPFPIISPPFYWQS